MLPEASIMHDGRPFRVCHVTAGPLSGGAARGVLNLHQALLDAGCESTLVTDIVGGPPPDGVMQLPALLHPKLDQTARRSLEQLPVKMYRGRSKAIFSTGLTGRSLRAVARGAKADIVNLHWIGGGMISIRSLARVRVPLVWTLRDMWPATGGCHYPTIHQCDRFEHGCGRCPHLSSRRQLDLSRLVFWNKARCLPADLTIVGISNWIAEEARRSPLLRGRQILAIPNCIDTEVFAPFDRASARRLLGLPLDGKLVLAGGLNPRDPYKGWSHLMRALELAQPTSHTIVFGNLSTSGAFEIPRLIRSFGRVNDDLKLRVIYAAADVFVSAATSEAFGKTIAEALACGTPAVVFEATGPRDIVEHLVCGYLATPFKPQSLADGINWVLNHPKPEALRIAARTRAERHFSKPPAARAYLELYGRLLRTGTRAVPDARG